MNKILFCLLFISFSIYTGKQNLCKVISDSEIILTIKGNNTQPILNNQIIELSDLNVKHHNYTFNETPSEILVNGNKVNITSEYQFDSQGEHTIQIYFKKPLKSMNNFFSKWEDLIEVNLSFSNIDDVSTMYHFIRIDTLRIDNSSILDLDFVNKYSALKTISISIDQYNKNKDLIDDLVALGIIVYKDSVICLNDLVN